MLGPAEPPAIWADLVSQHPKAGASHAARLWLPVQSMQSHSIASGSLVMVSAKPSMDVSKKGRATVLPSVGNRQMDLPAYITEVWPSTNLTGGFAALSPSLISGLTTSMGHAPSKVAIRHLQGSQLPSEPCHSLQLGLMEQDPGSSPQHARDKAGEWLANALAAGQTQQMSMLQLLAARILCGRYLVPGNLVTLPVLGHHFMFRVLGIPGSTEGTCAATPALVGSTTQIILMGSGAGGAPSTFGHFEALSVGGKAALAASAALGEGERQVAGEEGAGSAAARRAATLGALAAHDGYGSLGGVVEYARALRALINLPAKAGRLFTRYGVQRPRGVLLWGPPGTGKTCLARAAAADAGQPVFLINGPDLVSQFYGESEAGLRGVFAAARAAAPAIILIDELDALVPSRSHAEGGSGGQQQGGATSDTSARIVSALLTEMDGLHGLGAGDDGVVVLATTNRPEAVDVALRRPGRFDRDIEVGVPSPRARAEILRGQLLRLRHNLTDADIEQLAACAHGYVGADLAALCQEAAICALRHQVSGKSSASPVVTMADFQCAKTCIRPSAMRELALEVPQVSWEDVGGLQVVKERLQEAVSAQAQPPQGSRLSIKGLKGVLLYGPPGCSKTLLVRAAATEANLNFIAVKGSELLSKYVGESEKAIAALFSRARQSAPAIIFFDEIDGMAAPRDVAAGGGNDTASRILSQLLIEMDGLKALKGVLILAATNRPDHIDPALLRPGRFDRLLYVPPPDSGSREAILRIHTRGMPLASAVDLQGLADSLEGYTGADLKAVVREAALAALSEDKGADCIAARHFSHACQVVKGTGTLSAAAAALYESFRSSGGISLS